MSEQEKKSGLTAAEGTAVVMMEQSKTSKHKQPYRPNELHEESPSDPQHKRTKAPAVLSVAEELKDSTNSLEMKEQIESDRAMSSEKFKHKVAKKLSSNTKRRGSSPEAIALAPIDSEVKKGAPMPSTQPIPTDVASVASGADLEAVKAGADNKEDDDSIIEDDAQVQTPEAAKRSSEWATNDCAAKKKEISWASKDYLDKTPPKEVGKQSQCTLLERKASIGPCFRSKICLGVPSGITLCIPKKSNRIVNENVTMPSVINISVSKKCLADHSRSQIDSDRKGATGEGSSNTKKCSVDKSKSKTENKQAGDLTTNEGSGESQADGVRVTTLGFLKGKIVAIKGKLKNTLKV